jgi:NAD(P)H-dependent FMN reductase
MKVAVILSSVRENNTGHKIKKFAKKIVEEQGWTALVIDPIEFNLPLIDRMYKEMKEPEEKFVRLHNMLNEADGFLIVTAEYNHTIPPALTNLIDHFGEEYTCKPSAIISYSTGIIAGARAAEQLKLVCSHLGMPPISNVISISQARENIDENGDSVNGVYEKLSKNFLKEFLWYMEALKVQRDKRKLK